MSYNYEINLKRNAMTPKV